LYFETDKGDGFREPGFSKERRLEPQITIGLLTDAAGFPLMVEAFEGNKAETKTMIPTIGVFGDRRMTGGVPDLGCARASWWTSCWGRQQPRCPHCHGSTGGDP